MVATLECDIQYCPFKSSGEAAQRKQAPSSEQKAPGRKLMRRATKSIITFEHKGVLTVNIISASNLTVRACVRLLSWRSANPACLTHPSNNNVSSYFSWMK